MSRLGYMFFILALCEEVFSNEYQGKQNGFIQPLDFAPIFASEDTGSLASSPIATAVLNVDKSQYPQLFDTIVSSSIDSIKRRVAPTPNNAFSAERFGFHPIASQTFDYAGPSARQVAHPNLRQHQRQTHLPIQLELAPLRYDIRTVHDADYKVYNPEEDKQGGEILAALKKNPNVSSYFKPESTNVEVAHPLKYRQEESSENIDEQNYRHNPYTTGSSRIRRYTPGRKRENLRKSSDEDDGYDYKGDYHSRPKAFDGESYSSAYKEEKDPNKDYEYPFYDDSGYDNKEYERIKELSEKQAAEVKQNPGNCKEVLRDGMSCQVCKDPKTGGNYESCSYAAEPKNNKYAYSKEKKFNSNDEPDEPEEEQKNNNRPEKYEEVPEDRSSSQEEPEKPSKEYRKEDDDDSDDKYKAFYVHTSKPKPSEALRASSQSESSEEKGDSLVKPYNYKQALPGFYSDNEPKKDVEHVLAELQKKDRSSCIKVQKNGMTCFQCVDKSGLKNEECMYVSESAPKRSHLAYQEVKKYKYKPPTIPNVNNQEAESKTLTASAPVVQKSAAYVVANPAYGKKLKRKKSPQVSTAILTAPSSSVIVSLPPIVPPILPSASNTQRIKRNAESDAEARAEIVDETNIAPPEEFAGDNSKGAFWAETRPRYSAALGVTLPEFMLSRSEHETSFDEVVAGA